MIAAQAEEIERLRERLANETDAMEGVETQLNEANIAVVSAEAEVTALTEEGTRPG